MLLAVSLCLSVPPPVSAPSTCLTSDADTAQCQDVRVRECGWLYVCARACTCVSVRACSVCLTDLLSVCACACSVVL